MAKTYIEIVNDVLRRLREDTVAICTDNDYSELIAQFVADAYQEILDDHTWESLKHTINIAIVAPTTTYILSTYIADGGNVPSTERVAKDDSELLWRSGSSVVPQVWVSQSPSTGASIIPLYVPRERLEDLKALDPAATGADPMYFSVYPSSLTEGSPPDLILEVWPTPTADRTMKMRFWTGPEQLLCDGNTDSYKLRVPERPVYLLALMYALNERGEEMGEPGGMAEVRYLNALATAKEKDINAAQRSDRNDWVRR